MHPKRTTKSGTVPRPKNRSALRIAIGNACYGTARRFSWLLHAGRFARQQVPPLPFLQFAHHTPLLRKLKDVDMQYQYNKITNLRLAAQKLNGVVVRPGESLSYWRLIGKPTRRAGYLDGMVLRGGKVCSGVGGGPSGPIGDGMSGISSVSEVPGGVTESTGFGVIGPD